MFLRYLLLYIYIYPIIIFNIILSEPIFGQEPDSITESKELKIRYAGEFNHVPVGCRNVAMGNTGVVQPYSNISCFWNPSLIALSRLYNVNVEGAKLYGGLSSLGAISFVAPVQNGLNAGLIYKAFFPDNIIERDSLPGSFFERQYNYNIDGYPSKGVFHNNQHSVIVSVAKLFSIPIPRPANFALPMPVDVGVGLNIKSLWQTMSPGDKVRMGYNINLDLGLCLRIGTDYNLAEKSIQREILIAMSLRDFLPTKMIWLHSYNDYEEPVDGSQYFGLSYIDRSGFLFGDWTVSLSLHRLYDITLHAGLEGKFFDIVAFRCGISNKIAALGAGIHYKNYSLDYSFTFDKIDYSFLRLAVGAEF